MIDRIIQELFEFITIVFPFALVWWLWREFIKETNKDIDNERNKKSM